MNDLSSTPASITVVFPRADDGHLSTEMAQITVTLASLALPEYVSVTGIAYSHVLHRYEKATFVGGTWSNRTTLTSLAKQAATDWYHWQLANLDVQYDGVVPWNPDGLHDVEWRYDGNIKTHVFRGVYNPKEDLLYAAPAVIGNELTVVNLTVINELTIYKIVNYFNTTINNYYTTIYYYNTDIIWYPGVPATLVSQVCHFTLKDWAVGASVAITNNTKTEVEDLTFSLQEPTTINIRGYFDFHGNGTAVANDEYRGTAFLDGVDLGTAGGHAVWRSYGANARQTVAYEWPSSNVTIGSHTVLLKAWRESGSGSIMLEAETKLVVEAVPVIVVEREDYLFPNGTTVSTPVCTTDPKLCCVVTDQVSSSSPDSECAYCIPGTEPLAFSLVVAGFDGCGVDNIGGAPCQFCTAGTTPANWNINVNSFTGDFAVFNGNWTLTQRNDAEGCGWVLVRGSVIVSVTVSDSGVGSVYFTLDFYDSPALGGTGADISYVHEATPNPADCCQPVDANQQIGSTGSGNAPLIVRLTPGGCGGGSSCDFNGNYILYQADPCKWVGVKDASTKVIMWLKRIIAADGSLEVEVKLDFFCNDNLFAEYLHIYLASEINCCMDLPVQRTFTSCTDSPLNLTLVPLGCGSGSSSSGGGVGVTCCPGTNLPATLYATIIDEGGCPCIPGSYPMTWSGSGWTGTINKCGRPLQLTLACESGGGSGQWIFEIYDVASGHIYYSEFPSIRDCGPPLHLTFPSEVFSIPFSYECLGPAHISVQITP